MARENMEDSIFSNIEANSGETFDDNSATSTPDGGDTGDSGNSEPNSQLVQDGVIPAQPKEAPVDPRVQQPQKQEAVKPGLTKVNPKDPNSPFRDQQGNLTDANGNIIASRGSERRLAATLERTRTQNQDLQNRVAELTREMQQLRETNNLPQTLGLDRNDVNEAMQTAALFARDPVAGAQKAIEIALARGASLQQIVNDEFIPNVSLAATQRLLDERLKPIQQERETKQLEEQSQRQGRTLANQFMTDYPEAEVHREDIAAMMPEIEQKMQAQGRNVTKMEAAVLALRTIERFAIEKGLDPNRSLAEQIEERQLAASTQQPSQAPNGRNGGRPNAGERPTPPRPQTRPMPNGSRGAISEVRSSVANPNASIDQIVREAMRESGMDY